jgi:hypothetical protein
MNGRDKLMETTRHIIFIATIGVQFAADDIPQLSSVSAIIDRIEELSG